MKTETESIIRVIKKSLTAATTPMLRDLNELERLQMSSKNASEFARRTQQRVAETLREQLLSARPKYGYRDDIGNKTNGLVESYFLVAPLSGMQNFARALPLFATSVWVLSKNEKDEWGIDVACLLSPLLDDFFVADGKEAFHNQKWLRLTTGRSTATARTHHGNQPQPNEQNFGIPALELCYLAGHRIDRFRAVAVPLLATAAGMFIALSAGQKITDDAGGPITTATLAQTCAPLITDQTLTINFVAG